jgi:hypothetical protein
VQRELLVHGLRVAILNDATAYGFSVMITTVFVASGRRDRGGGRRPGTVRRLKVR